MRRKIIKKRKLMLLGAGTLAFGGLIVSAWKWVVKKHHEGLEELGLIDNK